MSPSQIGIYFTEGYLSDPSWKGAFTDVFFECTLIPPSNDGKGLLIDRNPKPGNYTTTTNTTNTNSTTVYSDDELRVRTNLVPKTKMDIGSDVGHGAWTPGVFINIKDMLLPKPDANDTTLSTLESLNAVWKMKVVARNSSNYDIPEIG